MAVRMASKKYTTVLPVSPGSTVGKSRRKLVLDSIDLHDLGCHAFKDGTTPAGRSVMRHNLSTRVKVVL
jgi:hypothetical protein